MNGIRFGEFIAEKRKACGITLRQMAVELEITAPYLSDIEKSRRNPPDIHLLHKIAALLKLNEEEVVYMLDLAGNDRKEVPPDLPEYIIETPIVRAALRKAKKVATEADWLEFMEHLDRK